MKIKLDGYYFGVLINGLYTRRNRYDDATNEIIDTLLLRLVDEGDSLNTNRKKKICFQPIELTVVRQCLLDWRYRQVQAEKDVAVEAISELLAKFI